MLGKLARWLRLLGYDTLYESSIKDKLLLDKASADNRIILTKDNQIVQDCSKDKCLLIKSSNPYLQLKEIILKFKLDPWKGLFTRCVYCNNRVYQIVEEEIIKNEVPAFAREDSAPFYKCPQCSRVYWKGSHHDMVRDIINELLKK